MIKKDPWYCHTCKLRHANACPSLWGGNFVPAPREITFSELLEIYNDMGFRPYPSTRKMLNSNDVYKRLSAKEIYEFWNYFIIEKRQQIYRTHKWNN